MLGTTRPIRRRAQLEFGPLAAGALVAVWAALGLGAYTGNLPIPHAHLVFLFLPACAIAALVLSPRTFSANLWIGAGGAALVALALWAHPYVESHPRVILGAAVAPAAGVIAARWPAAITLAVLAVTGAVGSILAFTSIAPAYLIDFALAGLLLALLWRALIGGGISGGQIMVAVPVVVLFILVGFVQMLGAADFSTAQQAFHNSAWHFVAFPAIALAGWAASVRLRVSRGFLVIAGLVAAYAVLRLIIGPAAVEKERALNLAPINILPGGDVGLFGSTTGRQQLAAWLGMSIPFSVGLLFVERPKWRLVAAATAGLSAVALIATQTRVGLVGAVIGLAVVLPLAASARSLPGLRYGRVAAAAAAVLVCLAVGFLVTDGGSHAVQQRYTRIITPGKDPAFSTRVNLWGGAVSAIERKPQGYGLGSVGQLTTVKAQQVGTSSSGEFTTIDNSYLTVGFEQGFLVMVLFITAMLLTAVGLSRRARLLVSPADAGIALASAGAFASFAVNLLVTDNISDYTTVTAWILAGLGAAAIAARWNEAET